MIRPQFFVEELNKQGIDFYTGVPDSLLKDFCGYIQDNVDSSHNIIAANEGGAVGLAAGYHLATGKIGLVYMQNSGEGNIINPLLSLVDKEVYHIPVLLLIGWRGKPGVHDEPQHIKQGRVTTALLDTMEIEYDILSSDENVASGQIAKAIESLRKDNIYALIVEKGTFESYQIQTVRKNSLTLSREEAIQTVASCIGENDIVVSTTGMISRELFEFRTSRGEGHERDFLTVGSMGHASQIALGIAIEKQDRRIWCFDGDGACIMHMGSLAIIAEQRLRKYIHVVFNNGAHDSVGGQPTVGLDINLPAIAKAAGYCTIISCDSMETLKNAITEIKDSEGPVFIEVKVRKGNRKDLGRPTTTPVENKKALMQFLKD